MRNVWRHRRPGSPGCAFTVGLHGDAGCASATRILMLGPHVHDTVIVSAPAPTCTTCRHGHLGTLLGSAFVVEAGPLYFWLPFLVCLLALAELHLRTVRLVVAFVVGHIGATLLVAAASGRGGRARLDAVVHHPRQRRRNELRRPGGARGADGSDPAAAGGRRGSAGGFRRALSAGGRRRRFHRRGPRRRADPRRAGASLGSVRPVHWTPVRLLMLAASSGFGFLMLAHHWGSWLRRRLRRAGRVRGLPGRPAWQGRAARCSPRR